MPTKKIARLTELGRRKAALTAQLATVNAKAQGYNAWVRGLCGGLVDSCWDDAAAVEEGGATAPTGKWLPIGGKAAAADGKHPGPSATLLMAAAGASVIGQFK